MRYNTTADLRILADSYRYMARAYIELLGDHERGRELFAHARYLDEVLYYYGRRS